jgi:hypothetical protein
MMRVMKKRMVKYAVEERHFSIPSLVTDGVEKLPTAIVHLMML